jgi:glycopeptide antibiotics resistance protein
MLHFGGADANGSSNLVPFKTILSYLSGSKGLVIVGVNIAGNIGLTVPLGVLLPSVWRTVSWKYALLLSFATGFLVEGMQVVLDTGIFDIDDVLLNGLGVMIGYWIYLFVAHGLAAPRYRNVVIACLLVVSGAAVLAVAIYPGIRLSAAPGPDVLRGSQIAAFPPMGVTCFDNFSSVVAGGYANPSFNVPEFELKDVTHFRCASARGFEQYEIAGTDRAGHTFYVHHASGGVAASGADSYIDHCSVRDDVIVMSTKSIGRSGMSEPGTCVFTEGFPRDADSIYVFNR